MALSDAQTSVTNAVRIFNAKILAASETERFRLVQGELWVRGNRICHVGPLDENRARELKESLGPECSLREIDAEGNLVCPGFKNAHTHTPMTAFRSYAEGLPLWQWLTEKIFPAEALLTGDDCYWLTTLGIMEYLTSGITANFDMYYFAESNAKAAADCGFRSVFTGAYSQFYPALDVHEERFHSIRELSPLTSYMLGYHAEYTNSEELLTKLAKLADRLKSPVWGHNSETESEVADCIRRCGMTPTRFAESLGLYEHGGGGYHCVWFSDEDMEIFRKRGLTAVTNPSSNLKLASGICNAAALLKAGVPVAIGTDGPSSNNCLDMFREMFLASGLSKVVSKDAACLGADEVLYMATCTGAQAMGLADCDGIAEGKLADLVLIDLQRPNMQPENDLVANIVYSGSKENVKMTMIDGRILYEDRKFFIGQEPKEIYAKANAVIRRIREKLGA